MENEKEKEKEAANGSPAVNKTPKSSAKKSRGPPQSSVDTFAVQCNDCFKWRTLATEDQFEEFRSKQSEDPFVCNKLEGIVCDTPADIEYDSSRTWVMDKPNIPKTPKGFQRVIVLRRDYSKMDVQYITPDGTRVRAAPGIITYLKEHPEYSNVSPTDFCFTSPKVMSDTIPEHIEKKSSSPNVKSPSVKKQKKST
ncbi:putative transcription factor & chromatin remodeling CW-Zn family [Helianthus annuus]|uniref:Putative methyl-CPG-binding domain 1 n=1 Tax=Helianthus annuus TaxID=4232 RepID=A0A251V0A1_HELAN|nr:methyl-CpG-binding domain-containing protein 4 [Helianthus annuus]KAF5811162.1 putative transcription factor & chromatin remodeling CW-Zn family [Helianthus annuus]KAJ0581860.1 putative transcription factor & chromatin remodeling CW-Zn family [Helianthus annuus]KAJ0589940.1 putative transcription factor & chromatin remodeling CW-Zn family [Helianthus annuus]KAJ0597837.1 putative transcription factor & chromatin remodeling CW-Zn family [Helianthus annuus]KAJ0927880.1 putative transcription f